VRARRDICAVVPVKDTRDAKQRLAGILTGSQRQKLAMAMLQDVLTALSATRELAGILVVTADRAAAELAARHGARVSDEGARNGRTGAVTAAAKRLAAEQLGLLEVPGDIPLLEARDVSELLAAHDRAPAFTIVPAHDQGGSNAVLCSPPDLVPLRFGENSFFAHLAAARSRGIEPRIVPLARVGLDVDTPDDLARFLSVPSRTRARDLLDGWRIRFHGQEVLS
jgi:2-phospho-L-lactate guanylyltransferase